MLSLGAFAELGYGVALTQNDFNNTSTVVKKEGTIEWDTDHVRCGGASNGISIGGPSWNWDDKYFDVKLANGVPEQLSFEWACNNVTSTDPDWYVKESADGTNWTTVWENNSSSASWTAVTKNLKPGTRYLRFCFSGNFAGNFRKIKVTEKIEMGTPSVESLDFGTVKVDADTTMSFTISWTNLEAAVTSSDAHFTVDPATIGEIGANAQTSTVAVSLVTNEAGTYSGTVTVEGRGKSAQVAVSGSVEKYNQTISWNPAASYDFNASIPVATATSGLAVTYEIANPAVLKFENGAFQPLYAGTTQVTAKQAGNYKYNAAPQVVKTIVITAQPTTAEENKSITVGTHENWYEYDLSTYAVGSYQLTHETTNAQGGVHTITLALTVTKQNTVRVPVALECCADDSVEFRGRWWSRPMTFYVDAPGEVADTVYEVTVTINESPSVEEYESAYAGETLEFDEEGWLLRGVTPVDGSYQVTKADTTELFFVRFSHTEKGCEMIQTKYVEVELPDAVDAEQEFAFCEGDSIEYHGEVFTEAGQYELFAEGEFVDTVVTVYVTIYEKEYRELEPRTVAAGETIELPDGEWLLGEETVSGEFVTTEEHVPGLEFVQYGETNDGCESVVKLTVTVTSREGVENVFVDGKAEKFFLNGELYIRRGEAVYTATGERVE